MTAPTHAISAAAKRSAANPASKLNRQVSLNCVRNIGVDWHFNAGLRHFTCFALAKAELRVSIGHDEEIEFDLWAGSGRAQRCI